MTKRRVLNIASRKKSDTMMCYTNVIVPRNDLNTTYTNNAATLVGNSETIIEDPYIFLWNASARDMDSNNNPGVIGSVGNRAIRTAQTCYMRGLKENIHIQVNNGTPWQWRRILFTAKGLTDSIPSAIGFQKYAETNNGYARVVNELRNTGWNNLRQQLFKGTYLQDWTEPILAALDNTNFNILYDKTRTLASGNEQGMIRTYKLWHAFNKNLVYGDKESGAGEGHSHYSTRGKPGMGDIYVVDIFRPRLGSDTDDRLVFKPNATLYWHEK